MKVYFQTFMATNGNFDWIAVGPRFQSLELAEGYLTFCTMKGKYKIDKIFEVE